METPPIDPAGRGLAAEGCPVPFAHERFAEAHWFLHQMVEHYHTPLVFRFSTNAFLSALKSVVDMLRLDLERAGHNEWRKIRFSRLRDDPVFNAFSRGRDIVVHRKPLVQSSQVQVGYFKYLRMKIVFQHEVRSDAPSTALLDDARGSRFFFPDDERPAEGEQLGVRRLYFEPALSLDDDVLTASHIAWKHVGDVLSEAHRLLGYKFDDHVVEPGAAHDVERVCLFMETDADPSILEKWGWV